MIQKYITYLKDNPKGYWFKAKPYGWGWVPVKWQGWLVVGIYIVAIILFGLTIDEVSPPNEIVFTFLLPIVLLTVTLIRICYWKGEKPRWMWGLPASPKPKSEGNPKENEAANRRFALQFNEYINNRNLEGLASLMNEDHVFIDSAGNTESGRERVKESWRGFFEAFPEYKNIFERVTERNDTVIMLGNSVCPNNEALDGPAIWTATIKNNKVTEWRVYDDTPENRKVLRVK